MSLAVLTLTRVVAMVYYYFFDLYSFVFSCSRLLCKMITVVVTAWWVCGREVPVETSTNILWELSRQGMDEA